MPDDPARAARLHRLREDVLELRRVALEAERDAQASIQAVASVHRASAANLVHYVALRSRDLRPLQVRLSTDGLSSLGRMEPRVMANLESIIRILDDALGTWSDLPPARPAQDVLSANAAALFGGEPDGRSTRIMVTLPSEAAAEPGFVAGLVAAGMDAARINCAHDDPATWTAMARNVAHADPSVPIAMDLSGPKLRTGPIAPGPAVVRFRPRRDELGRVQEPASLWIGEGADAVPVTEAESLHGLRPGDTLRLRDASGRTRHLTVAGVRDGAVRLEADRTVRLVPGSALRGRGHRIEVGALPAREQALRVRVGDTIVLTASQDPAIPGTTGVHTIGCTLPEAFAAVRRGHRIAFDDGTIAGVVTEADGTRIVAEVTDTRAGGKKLRAGKGINLPDTTLPVAAVTDEDREDLRTAVTIADIVQLSFARSPADVRQLLALLDEHAADDLGVVVKIETVAGFAALPEILLELLRRRRVGVMIARGDLAVEAGFERLTEVQEEILWLCEAAHVPVIWATQVLDTLAGSGVATRAEVTDAAAGERAECVMLNKGPRITDAIVALDDILRRMSGHHDKKRPLLRRLGAWNADRSRAATTATG